MVDTKMPHVHAPHGGIRGWRDFVTHIIVVAIGLLLALGLEQGVEAIHHAHQRQELEIQMRETFEANMRIAEKNLQVLNDLRAYLIELRGAVNARISGGSGTPPPESDRRNFVFAPPPNLGPYEASKLNGTVSLLDIDRIRTYNRVEFNYGLMQTTFQQFYEVLGEFRAFGDRFNTTNDDQGLYLPQPNIEELSAQQLVEYQVLIGKTIQLSRRYASQMLSNKVTNQLMLDGVDDENALTEAVANARTAD